MQPTQNTDHISIRMEVVVIDMRERRSRDVGRPPFVGTGNQKSITKRWVDVFIVSIEVDCASKLVSVRY